MRRQAECSGGEQAADSLPGTGTQEMLSLQGHVEIGTENGKSAVHATGSLMGTTFAVDFKADTDGSPITALSLTVPSEGENGSENVTLSLTAKTTVRENTENIFNANIVVTLRMQQGVLDVSFDIPMNVQLRSAEGDFSVEVLFAGLVEGSFVSTLSTGGSPTVDNLWQTATKLDATDEAEKDRFLDAFFFTYPWLTTGGNGRYDLPILMLYSETEEISLFSDGTFDYTEEVAVNITESTIGIGPFSVPYNPNGAATQTTVMTHTEKGSIPALLMIEADDYSVIIYVTETVKRPAIQLAAMRIPMLDPDYSGNVRYQAGAYTLTLQFPRELGTVTYQIEKTADGWLLNGILYGVSD